MEKNCGHLKIRLEHAWLQDWRTVSGLAKFKHGHDFPNNLKAHKLVLIAILTQIHTLMTDFCGNQWQIRGTAPRSGSGKSERY